MDIVRLYISPGHNFFGHHGLPAGTHETVEVESVECVAGRGLAGDRFFDFKEDYRGQITFLAWEVYEELLLLPGAPRLDPGVFRRNAVTRGVDLSEWIGRPFEIQGVHFQGIAECSPCAWMDEAFCPGAMLALKGRGGLRAKVLSDGILRVTGR